MTSDPIEPTSESETGADGESGLITAATSVKLSMESYDQGGIDALEVLRESLPTLRAEAGYRTGDALWKFLDAVIARAVEIVKASA